MMDAEPTASEIYSSCVCLGVQRAARGVAKRYDQAFRPLGITSGQFSILSSLLQGDSRPLTEWADLLGLDRTTLLRNLAPLQEQDFIEPLDSVDDKRIRRFRLSRKGKALVRSAIALWRSAQRETDQRIGPDAWKSLGPMLKRLANE